MERVYFTIVLQPLVFIGSSLETNTLHLFFFFGPIPFQNRSFHYKILLVYNVHISARSTFLSVWTFSFVSTSRGAERVSSPPVTAPPPPLPPSTRVFAPSTKHPVKTLRLRNVPYCRNMENRRRPIVKLKGFQSTPKIREFLSTHRGVR